MPYEVPPLPYDYGALEPTIDEETMHLHHDKHHQAYVTQANNALEGTEWANKPIEEVLRNLPSLPDDKRTVVRNNGGGHYLKSNNRRPDYIDAWWNVVNWPKVAEAFTAATK